LLEERKMLYKKKERNACDTGLILKHKRSQRESVEQEIESFMFEFKGMSDIDVRLASTSWGIPQPLIALILSLSSYAIHPQIPLGR
jgi:hypothetical protein